MLAGILTNNSYIRKSMSSVRMLISLEAKNLNSACLFSVVYNFEIPKDRTKAGKVTTPSKKTYLGWMRKRILLLSEYNTQSVSNATYIDKRLSKIFFLSDLAVIYST